MHLQTLDVDAEEVSPRFSATFLEPPPTAPLPVSALVPPGPPPPAPVLRPPVEGGEPLQSKDAKDSMKLQRHAVKNIIAAGFLGLLIPQASFASQPYAGKAPADIPAADVATAFIKASGKEMMCPLALWESLVTEGTLQGFPVCTQTFACKFCCSLYLPLANQLQMQQVLIVFKITC